MEDKRYTAKTLNDAITEACIDLGLQSHEFKYTVVQNATNGFFGIGAKPCIISVAVKSAEAEEKAPKQKNHPSQPKNDRPEKTEKKEKPERNEKSEKPVKQEKSEAKAEGDSKNKGNSEKRENFKKNNNNNNSRKKHEGKPERAEKQNVPSKKEEKAAEKAPVEKKEKKPERTGTVNGNPEKTAEAFLTGLFQSMDMKISYSGQFNTENNELIVDLSGEDMGVLIGKRGQTLDALQYLTSQVVNKHQGAYIRVKLDTENYRERRKETMETLAQNIAQKVKRTKKPVALEPMNPYERRIIHSVLQSDKEVITRSEGVEPYRHVVVCPARKKRSSSNVNN